MTELDISKSLTIGRGWVYLMRAAHGVKVGITRSNPESRRIQIELAAGLPIELVDAWDCGDRNPFRVEASVHHRLAAARGIGEWFSCAAEVARAAIVDALGADLRAWEPHSVRTTGRSGRPSSSPPGLAIRELRLAHQLGLAQLERLTGINRAAWSQIERGLMLPMPAHLQALSRVFDVPLASWRVRFLLETEAA